MCLAIACNGCSSLKLPFHRLANYSPFIPSHPLPWRSAIDFEAPLDLEDNATIHQASFELDD